MQWENSKATHHVLECMVFSRQIRCVLPACFSLCSFYNKKKYWFFRSSCFPYVLLFKPLNRKTVCCESWCEHFSIGGCPIVVLFFLAVVNTWHALNCKTGLTLALLADLEVIICVRCWNSVQFFSVILGWTFITIELLDSAIWNLVQVNISKF
jgi:hypothetical protein